MRGQESYCVTLSTSYNPGPFQKFICGIKNISVLYVFPLFFRFFNFLDFLKENVGAFLGALPKIGIDSAPFVTVDLVDEKRPAQVLKGSSPLFSLLSPLS